MKGIIVFYINYGNNESFDNLSKITKEQNKTLINELQNEGYKVAYIPVVGESTRVEKVEFYGN